MVEVGLTSTAGRSPCLGSCVWTWVGRLPGRLVGGSRWTANHCTRRAPQSNDLASGHDMGSPRSIHGWHGMAWRGLPAISLERSSRAAMRSTAAVPLAGWPWADRRRRGHAPPLIPRHDDKPTSQQVLLELGRIVRGLYQSAGLGLAYYAVPVVDADTQTYADADEPLLRSCAAAFCRPRWGSGLRGKRARASTPSLRYLLPRLMLGRLDR